MLGVPVGRVKIGLRERQRRERRRRILDAAADLFRRHPGEHVTTEEIADVAMVSSPTVYNLVGTREELLVALLHDLLAGLSATTDADDPIQRAEDAVTACAALFAGDPPVNRYLVRALGAWDRKGAAHDLDLVAIQSEPLRQAQGDGALARQVDPQRLAATVYHAFNGALTRWAVGDLDDDQLRGETHYAFLRIIGPHVIDQRRHNALAATARRLERELGRSPN